MIRTYLREILITGGLLAALITLIVTGTRSKRAWRRDAKAKLYHEFMHATHEWDKVTNEDEHPDDRKYPNIFKILILEMTPYITNNTISDMLGTYGRYCERMLDWDLHPQVRQDTGIALSVIGGTLREMMQRDLALEAEDWHFVKQCGRRLRGVWRSWRHHVWMLQTQPNVCFFYITSVMLLAMISSMVIILIFNASYAARLAASITMGLAGLYGATGLFRHLLLLTAWVAFSGFLVASLWRVV